MRAAPQQRAVAAGAALPRPTLAATIAWRPNCQTRRKTAAERDALIARLRDLLASGEHTVHSASEVLGISTSHAHALARDAGLKSPAGLARAARVKAAMAAQASRAAKNAARRQQQIDRMRELILAGYTIKGAQREMGVTDNIARTLYRRCGVTVDPEAVRRAMAEGGRHSMEKRLAATADERAAKKAAAEPKPRKPRPPKAAKPKPVRVKAASRRAPQADAVTKAAHTVGGNMLRHRKATPEERAAAWRAQNHARRTAALPRVTDAEAADLVTQFLARGGQVTMCPKRAAAPINNGDGWS